MKSGLSKTAQITAGMNNIATHLRLTYNWIELVHFGQTLDFPNLFISFENKLTDSEQCGHFMCYLLVDA